MCNPTQFCRRTICLALAALVGVLLLLPSSDARAGNNLFRSRSVGGISIDIDGVIKQATLAEKQDLFHKIRQDTQKVTPEFNQTSEMRSIQGENISESVCFSKPSPSTHNHRFPVEHKAHR